MSNEIKIGDWVTQYQKGYWRVERIVPVLHRVTQPPQLAEILVLKKGCDEKFVPRNGIATCNLHWCKKVSDEIKDKILKTLAQDPKALKAFEAYANTQFTNTIHNIPLLLENAEIDEVQNLVDNAPTVLYYADLQNFKDKIKKYDGQDRLRTHGNAGKLISCLVQLTNYNVETDDNNDEIWRDPKLIVNK